MKEILILRVIIEKRQVKIEQEKIKTIKEQKTPTKVKNIESFLGFANFYWKFIQNFSYTTKPLNKLKGKKKWIWNEEHNKAFEKLKEKITSQLILSLSKKKEKFRIKTDVSEHTIRRVLSQEQERKWKLIAFLSRTM